MFAITPVNTTTVYLLRHAEAEGTGVKDPLTPAGQAAAEALVPTLEALEIDGIFSSPATRAQETAAPLAAKLDLTVMSMTDLREQRLSMAGTAPDDPMLESRFTNRMQARPGGEHFNAAALRLRAAVKAISRRPMLAPLMVTHGGLIASLLSQLDKTYGYAEFTAMPRPALFKLTHIKGTPRTVEPVTL
ncbi:MAG: histidine phosphatase family protein [Pseudomonadota bacterium]